MVQLQKDCVHMFQGGGLDLNLQCPTLATLSRVYPAFAVCIGALLQHLPHDPKRGGRNKMIVFLTSCAVTTRA